MRACSPVMIVGSKEERDYFAKRRCESWEANPEGYKQQAKRLRPAKRFMRGVVKEVVESIMNPKAMREEKG